MRKLLIAALLCLPALQAGSQSFEALRAKATPEGAVLPKGSYVEGIIVSDYTSLNMGANPQIEWNKVEERMCYCIGYLENEDGSMGFKLVFKDIYDNRAPRFSRVRINLAGCAAVREEDPERYTLEGISADNVEILGQAAPPAKERHIGELAPQDIYTYVTLKDVEFLSKEGSYTNVREFYVQPTYINYFKKPKHSDWFDEAGCHARDKNGDAIFLPVNTVCSWRRRGDRMPSGIGEISGILVSETLRRSGLPGPLQMRISGPSAVNIPMDGSSSYETIASWNWDRNYYCALNCESGQKKWLSGLRIDSERVGADKGDGWLSVTVQAQMGLEKDYNTRCARDGLVPGEGNRECAAIVYDSRSADWITENGAVLIETSTEGFSGKGLVLDWTWLAGYGKAKSAFGFPAHWQVSYSLDGRNYIPVQQVFHLRPLAWSDEAPVSYDAAVGYTENMIVLPAFLLGKDRVCIRISPADRVMTQQRAAPSDPIDAGRPDDSSSFALRIGKINLNALK